MMALFLILDGANWRSNGLHDYRYRDGFWRQECRLKVGFAENLTALEGLFIKLPDGDDEWELGGGPVIEKIMMVLRGGGRPGEAPRALREISKKESDHTRINAPSKAYKAIWPERIADMVQSMAADADRNCAVGELTQFFIWNCGSEKPTSSGICFAYTYLAATFRERLAEGVTPSTSQLTTCITEGNRCGRARTHAERLHGPT